MPETKADLRAEIRELAGVSSRTAGTGQFRSRTLEKIVEAIGGQPWGGTPSHRSQIRRELGFIESAESDGNPLRKAELEELRDALGRDDTEVVTDGGLPFGEDDIMVRRARLEPGLGDEDDVDDDDRELATDGGTARAGSEKRNPEDYPSEETIYSFYGSVEAAGFSIVDENGQPITAEELRVNLYDHWGILESGDDDGPELRTDGGTAVGGSGRPTCPATHLPDPEYDLDPAPCKTVLKRENGQWVCDIHGPQTVPEYEATNDVPETEQVKLTDGGTSGRRPLYQLLHARNYWEALSAVKFIDQYASGVSGDKFTGEQPQAPIAVSLLDVVIDHHDKDFQTVWDDYETAVASGASAEIQSLFTDDDPEIRTDGGVALYLTTIECGSCEGQTTFAHQGLNVPIDQEAPWPDIRVRPKCSEPLPGDLALVISEVANAERTDTLDTDNGRDDRAVSPLVGLLLIVAIAVTMTLIVGAVLGVL